MPPIFAEPVGQLMSQVMKAQDIWNKVGREEEIEADLANLAFTALTTALPLQKEAADREPEDFVKYCYEKVGMEESEIPDPEDINKSTVFARCLLQKICQFFMTVHQRAATSAQHAFTLPPEVKEKLEEQQAALDDMRIAAKEEYDERAASGDPKIVKMPGAAETDPQQAPSEKEKSEAEKQDE